MGNKKWCYSTDEENFNTDVDFDTKEEAIYAGKEYARDCECEHYYVAQLASIHPKVDTEYMLEKIGEHIYETSGEVAEDYLCDVNKVQIKELDALLNDVFTKWLDRHSLQPSFYNVKNMSCHSVD